MRQRQVFDARYCERVHLSSGLEARIRLMRSDDHLRILRAPRLGSRISLELDFFCSVEGVAASREVALIVISDSGAAYGGARGFRIRAGVWHATVTAVDGALTSLLLDRLSSAMLDRGACEVRFEFAPDDREMWHLLSELAPRSAFRDCDERIHCTVSLR